MQYPEAIDRYVVSPLELLWAKLVDIVPSLLAATLLLVVGYLLARVLSLALDRALDLLGLNKLSRRVGVEKALASAGLTKSLSWMVGKVGFWLVMLAFLVSATDALGLPRVSEAVYEFLLYIPRIIGALVLLLVGLFVADVTRSVVRGAGESAELDYANGLGAFAYGLLAMITVVLAVGQLGLRTELLDRIITIVIFAAGGGLALAVGLGGRDVARQILSGIYVRDLYDAGDRVQVDGVSGEIITVGPVKTLIGMADGTEVSVANQAMIEGRVQRNRA